MYLKHFGLREQPFSLTPDTSFFFACASYQAALNTLLIAVRNGEGFIKITGEVGNGKTMLCRKFLMALNQRVPSATPVGVTTEAESIAKQPFLIAYIPNPCLEPRSLLLVLAEQFGLSVADSIDQHQLLKALTRCLLDCARNGRRALLCLDEAQAMPLNSLEVLRLLTNLETEKRKLLQVVLFGQPELDDNLRAHSVRQLRQRITFQHQLRGLQRAEVDRYLRHRLGVAGFAGETLFSKAAVAKLQRITKGTPRLINIVAHKALMVAFGQGHQQVSVGDIALAGKDTPQSLYDWLIWQILAAGLLLTTLLWLLWMVLR
ncbi:MAG: AAA family ATPase [Sideroxydans sp.]|nr:AAA family ATPase [Sideroxydans sp.]